MSRRGSLAVACLLLGFLAVVAFRSAQPDPEARLPRRFRLVGLIQREQRTARELRIEADDLRRQVQAERRRAATVDAGSQEVEDSLSGARLTAGLQAMEGDGVEVVLDDSDLKTSPSGNVNDLVIHSQDVQAVVNALWRAGAEAVAINGQRLVSTSAVLCVGNTLLLNGTVHSPPYTVVAAGASRDRFDADRAVRRLRADATAFGLRFSVGRTTAKIPAYDGSVRPRFAEPVP